MPPILKSTFKFRILTPNIVLYWYNFSVKNKLLLDTQTVVRSAGARCSVKTSIGFYITHFKKRTIKNLKYPDVDCSILVSAPWDIVRTFALLFAKKTVKAYQIYSLVIKYF